MRVLDDIFGNRKFGEAQSRLCIPSFDGRYSEVYIFKTPHHPDFRRDAKEYMTKVAAATAAAPTFYRPLEDNGYTFVDGGVWANNPVMIALVDALSCFALQRERVRVLSLGCGDNPYVVDDAKISRGGLWVWRDIINASVRLQSQNVLGQAGLLVGADKVIRIDVPAIKEKIELDDWSGAVAHLPCAANRSLEEQGKDVASVFLSEPANPYQPIVAG